MWLSRVLWVHLVPNFFSLEGCGAWCGIGCGARNRALIFPSREVVFLVPPWLGCVALDTPKSLCYHLLRGNKRLAACGSNSKAERDREATLAQLVEHPICNRKVVGSIPMGGSRFHAGSRLADGGFG